MGWDNSFDWDGKDMDMCLGKAVLYVGGTSRLALSIVNCAIGETVCNYY